ncbi:hypothetical protein BGZ54_000027 [Gamsiella multidivaricata]|nr:hypothetical protein BGZ54_000027 [Gamsiella multidivaricata]
MSRQKRAQKEDKLARGINPFRTLLDKLAAAGKHQKRDHYGDDGSDDNEGKGEEDRKGWSPSFGSSLTSMPRRGNKAASSDDGDNKESSLDMRQAMELSPPSTPIAGAPDGGMIWIDISSWQTAGCWVPGGVHGICPYQDPDNTVALQEIIKVSTIGGVIILGLVGIFLYLKCRRNVRLRKANKRRAVVRNKIMRTEVETVPA